MNEFQFTEDYFLYRPRKQGIYPIHESDWNRLKRMIQGIVPYKRIFQILASIAFGVFASAILSLIGFQSAKELDSWVLPTTWAILVGSVILGIALLILDHQQTEIITLSVNDVLQEMRSIEASYHEPQAPTSSVTEVERQ